MMYDFGNAVMIHHHVPYQGGKRYYNVWCLYTGIIIGPSHGANRRRFKQPHRCPERLPINSRRARIGSSVNSTAASCGDNFVQLSAHDEFCISSSSGLHRNAVGC